MGVPCVMQLKWMKFRYGSPHDKGLAERKIVPGKKKRNPRGGAGLRN
jgi:hypothetical protein